MMKILFGLITGWLALVFLIAFCAGAFSQDYPSDIAWQDRECAFEDDLLAEYEIKGMKLAYGSGDDTAFMMMDDWTGMVFKSDPDGLFCQEAKIGEEEAMILLNAVEYSMEMRCPYGE